MSIDKLVAASKKKVVTADGIKRLNKRLADAEERFVEEERIKNCDYQSFLNKEYTL